MKQLVCEMCGNADLIKQDGVFVCQFCGCKYSLEEARKLMIEGTVEIQGTVKVDNSHMIENYLEAALTAQEAGDNAGAESYCNKIIEIDPTNHKALMLKGEVVMWQSSFQNSRIDEGVSYFVKAILNAPDDEKNNLIEVGKEQIKKVWSAMISIRGERFAKWPDDEEGEGFIDDISSTISTGLEFLRKTGGAIPLRELTEPIAREINQSVLTAYNNVILPEYKSERYPFPDDDDWFEYMGRVDRCISLLEKAVELSDEDGDEDITRYENLIFLQKAVIESCSYKSEYFDFKKHMGPVWVKRGEDACRADGMFPDSEHNRIFMKSKVLTAEAQNARKEKIKEYENKITKIKNEVQDSTQNDETGNLNCTDSLLVVKEVFKIPRGLVVEGSLNESVSCGDTVTIDGKDFLVSGIVYKKTIVDEAAPGMNVGILLARAKLTDCQIGAVLYKKRS